MSAKDRRFWIDHLANTGETVVLEGSEARHAQTVLRCQVNDPVTLLDGKGNIALGKIARMEKKTVEIQTTSREFHPEPMKRVVLIQSWLKGKSMDWTLQKATEIGATDIVPIWTRRSEIRLKPKDVAGKVEKWETTIRESCKQCGRLHAPILHSPLPFQDALETWTDKESQLSMVAALTPRTQSVHQTISEASENNYETGVSIWIGPEGDFTEEEYQQLFQRNASPVRLGPHILRSETAALAGLTLIVEAIST